MDMPVNAGPIALQFVYIQAKGDARPEPKGHAAQIFSGDDVPMPPQTTSRVDCYFRVRWEMDAVTLAAMIAAVKDVDVEIGGLSSQLVDLWHAIQVGKPANVRLNLHCSVSQDSPSRSP